MFKEFARLDEGARTASGLGLGLSIVDRISRVLHHPVELRSEQGRGTLFRVSIPVVKAPPVAASAREATPIRPVSEPLKGLKVLCIDNEPQILDGMRVLLGGWGCEVLTAESLAVLSTLALSLPSPPDAIVADYHLDDGTGIDAVAAARAAFGPGLPALMVTADRSPKCARRPSATGSRCRTSR